MTLSTEHLSKELSKNWVHVRDYTRAEANKNNYLQNETDEVMRQYFRGEYETWQLVNELTTVEKLYFDKSAEAKEKK